MKIDQLQFESVVGGTHICKIFVRYECRKLNGVGFEEAKVQKVI